MKNLTNKKGFTVVEMLIAIVVLSILAAVFVPRIHNSAIKAVQKVNAHAADSIVRSVSAEFPRAKVLTISAAEYCESVGTKLSDYKMVGVSTNYWDFYDFRKVIPAGTEVIVGFNQSTPGYAGTALIPKNFKPE